MTLLRITGLSHYFHAVEEGSVLPNLDARIAELCRERFRRIDRFIQLSLLGSAECVKGKVLAADCGLYIGSGVGPVGNNIVVQEALWKHHKSPMPFNFVNTLGSSAGYYVAKNLSLSGQSLFIARHKGSFEAALSCAAADISLGVMEQALVGVVEECTQPLSEHRMRQALPEGLPMAEGSHWVLLEKAQGTRPGAAVEPGPWDLAFHDSVSAARITRAALKEPLGSLGLLQKEAPGWELVRLSK